MGSQEFEMPSGAKLVVTLAPFTDSLALHKTLIRAARDLPITPDVLQMDVAALKDVLIEATTSQDVEKALFKCFERCVYNNMKVRPDLFDDPTVGETAREDYYSIAWAVVKVNCAPFVKRISSWLKTAFSKRPVVSPASPSV
jgi:hypothetical protein